MADKTKQEDLLDLITTLLKFNWFLSTTVAMQYTFQSSPYSKAVLNDSLITVDTTLLDQHKLYYCTIALSLCEIYDDVMVLIWKFTREMHMNDMKRTQVSMILFVMYRK